jgi:hypothetical protein
MKPIIWQTARLTYAYLLIAMASASCVPSSNMVLTVLSISSRAEAVKYANVSTVTYHIAKET